MTREMFYIGVCNSVNIFKARIFVSIHARNLPLHSLNCLYVAKEVAGSRLDYEGSS